MAAACVPSDDEADAQTVRLTETLQQTGLGTAQSFGPPAM
jgi:hypothetical protein